MLYKFDSFKPLNRVNQLLDNSNAYMACIQYDDIIDCYLLPNILDDTLNQLAYYLLIAYDIRRFNSDNIKIIPLIDTSTHINQSCIIDNMNAYNIHLINHSSFNL
jgi:hypothetical protein